MPNHLVFITGATGFIGAHIATNALKAGYRVRLSVRRTEQIQKLKQFFSDFSDQLDFILVPDFTKPNAFVEAVRGVHFVIHVASPMLGQGSDFKRDFIDPAVEGTLSVLNAAKSVPSVERVLVMSSILALIPLGALWGPPLSVEENSDTTIEVDVNMPIPDDEVGHTIRYQGSKILAHQATKDWLKKTNPGFSVLTFHPTFVIGPSLFQTKPEQIDSINKFFLDTVRTGNIVIPPVFVDVRDVADTFIKALTVPVPNGQEFIVSGHPISWSEVGAEAKRLYPDAGFKLEPPPDEKPSLTVSNRAASELLGIRWRSQKELVDGVLNQQLSLEA
ncbi:hypothetical protein FDECE_3133 [Fusarium decemcellulare]|nr:hypothetical protein FDECE_3133 [Fusarium decemcellulare]